MAKNKSLKKSGSEGEQGVFHALFSAGMKKISVFFRNSAIVRFFSSYDEVEAYASDSLIVRSVRNVYGFIRKKITRKPHRELGTEQLNQQEVGVFVPSTLHRSLKTRISAATESSVVLQKAQQLLQGALYASMMSYGVLFFSFGLFTTVVQALLYFLLRPSDAAALDLFVGLALVLLSLPIMFKGYEPMLNSFRDSIVGNWVLRALRSSSDRTAHSKVYKPTFLFFIIGMAGGLLTYFAPPLALLVGIVVIITALCVLYVPEAGVCLILFGLPFFGKLDHSSLISAGAILYTGLCLLLKVIVGKRSLSFGLMDGVILLFGLLVLSTGWSAGAESVNSARLYVTMVAGYFVLANLLRSPAWIRRSLSVWTVSSFFVALTGIAEWSWDLGGSVALLSDSSVAVVYLLASVPVALICMLQSKKNGLGFLYFLAFVSDSACLILQGSALGTLALLIELFFFFVFYTRKIWVALLLFLLSLPVVSYFVWPEASTITETVRSLGNGELWIALWGVLEKAPLSGVGMSDGILMDMIASETVVDLSYSNTWLRIAVQLGIPGLLFFLGVLLVWYMAGFTLLRKHGAKSPTSGQYLAILSAVTAWLVVGNFTYVWSDNRILLLFWMSAGIARALQRAAKRGETPSLVDSNDHRSDGVYCVDRDFTFALASTEKQDYS